MTSNSSFRYGEMKEHQQCFSAGPDALPRMYQKVRKWRLSVDNGSG